VELTRYWRSADVERVEPALYLSESITDPGREVAAAGALMGIPTMIPGIFFSRR
jgi:hypothetical protein